MRLGGPALAAATAVVCAALVTPPAAADPVDDARRRVTAAAGELENSTAAVRGAAASLADVAARLPAARREAATARGALAGAQARLTEATTQVRRAELATASAQRRVDEASVRVERGRATVAGLARRSYQRGPLGDLREIFRSGSPQDLVDRAETLKKVFRGQNDVLHDLAVDRLHLAGTTAELAGRQQALETLRAHAVAGENRARSASLRAEQAEVQVAGLVAERQRALRRAEAAREADVAEYKAANDASRALAARLRALAKKRAAELAAARARARARGAALPVGTRVASGRFAWPVDGHLTSRFGYRRHPIFGDVRFHAGVDIGADYGNPVWAAEGGTVIQAGAASGYGNLVMVSHGTRDGRDIVTAYAHMSEILVTEGQQVSRGQQVGRVGNTGNSTGPHLHFEVRRDGDPSEPLDWVSPPS